MTPKIAIAYVCSAFPSKSETFIYREVVALRERGWQIYVVGLNESPEKNNNLFTNFSHDSIVLYGKNFPIHLTKAVVEILTHPIHSLRTLSVAIVDALIPGEKL